MLTKIHVMVFLTGVVGCAALGSSAAYGEEGKGYADLAKSLASAKVTLQQGLTASESKGQPISAKFEVDEGQFQLSVYTAKGGAFQEVVVDYTTGAVAKAETITEADDLKAAKSQIAAMAKAKKPLKAAVDEAEHSVAGYRAVSVTPELKGGHAVAVVTLLKGTQAKSVTESLE